MFTWNAYRFDERRSFEQKQRNAARTFALLAVNMVLLGLVAWMIAGVQGVLWAAIGLVVVTLFVPRIGPAVVLRMHGARPIPPYSIPGLWRMTHELATRAGLRSTPRLFMIPSDVPNAFAVGSRGQSAIAISRGLLETLAAREIQGVIAHEISHIRNNDLALMHGAWMVARASKWLALAGLLMLVFALPLGALKHGMTIGLVLAVVPFGVDMLQLALSRSREFDADLDAAALTRDPRGLACALARMQALEGGLVRLLLGHRYPAAPAWLRSHPPTEERIQRLLQLESPVTVFPTRRVYVA